jgi:hypothetical protein
MYPESKEIPGDLMARVLERPDDPQWVDGLLFTHVRPDTVDWSEGARRSALSDEELAQRFSCSYLPLSAKERRTLGTLDHGKYPCPRLDGELWYYVDAAGSGTPAARLASLLSQDEEDWGEALDRKDAVLQDDPPVSGDRPAIHTGIVCYGVVDYRTPEEMAAAWRRIDHAVTARPDLTGRVLDTFGDLIRYYYGCASRGSAEMTVIW